MYAESGATRGIYMRNKTTMSRSNRAKGAKGQKEVQQLLLNKFNELEPDDCRSNPMGAGGEDILLSPMARKLLPLNIEVKRSKNIAMSRNMEQAKHHGDYEPAVFYREDRNKNWYVSVNADYLLNLLRQVSNE